MEFFSSAARFFVSTSTPPRFPFSLPQTTTTTTTTRSGASSASTSSPSTTSSTAGSRQWCAPGATTGSRARLTRTGTSATPTSTSGELFFPAFFFLLFFFYILSTFFRLFLGLSSDILIALCFSRAKKKERAGERQDRKKETKKNSLFQKKLHAFPSHLKKKKKKTQTANPAPRKSTSPRTPPRSSAASAT